MKEKNNKGNNEFSNILTISVLVLLVLVLLSVEHWDYLNKSEVATASLRNLFIVLAAVIGIPLAIWRSLVAKQQANASEHQAKTAEKRLRNETYEKGAEMLGSQTPSVRLGGIYSLKGLANEKPEEYQEQVMELLCAFIRNPPQEKEQTEKGNQQRTTKTEERKPSLPPILRDDVQTVINIIVYRHRELIGGLKWGQYKNLDLRGANLIGIQAVEGDLKNAMLNGAQLSRGRFQKTKLTGSNLVKSNLKGANLTGADLNKCNFRESDLSGIYAKNADFSECDVNGVNLNKALVSEAKFTKARVSNSNFSKATMQRAKLDFCTIIDVDFSKASMWRAVLTGTRFGSTTRTVVTTRGEKIERVYCKLTQKQLDEALSNPDFPPEIEPGTVDIETGELLVWRGGCITEDQHPQLILPPQIIRKGEIEKQQGAYVEWKEMGLRLVPEIINHLEGKKNSISVDKALAMLKNTVTQGCERVTFYGKKNSGVELCGITRMPDEGRIWMLFTYEEQGLSKDHKNYIFLNGTGPETVDGWKKWFDNIDWTISPTVEIWSEPVENLPIPEIKKLLR